MERNRNGERLVVNRILETDVVGVVGLTGSGKSELVKAIVESGAHRRIYFGGIVVNRVAELGLEAGPSSEQWVREELRREFGMAAIAILANPLIEYELNSGRKVLIDGIYSMAEYEYLLERYPQLITIAIHAARSLRYARLSQRRVRPLSAEQALARDFAEVKNLDKGGPIAIADQHFVNDGDIAHLRRFAHAILEGSHAL